MFSSFLLLLGLASIFSQCYAQDSELSNELPDELQFLVSVRHKRLGVYMCTGSLIHPFHVVTSALCLYKQSSDNLLISAGLKDFNSPEHTVEPRDIIVNENYVEDSNLAFDHDIALIRLRNSLGSPTMRYVNLPKQNEHVKELQRALFSGFMRVHFNKSDCAPLVFKQTTLITYEMKECNNYYPQLNTRFCARSACDTLTHLSNNNLGGPLVVDGTLIGLLSFREPKNTMPVPGKAYPSVFTRVSAYVNWINAHIVSDINKS